MPMKKSKIRSILYPRDTSKPFGDIHDENISPEEIYERFRQTRLKGDNHSYFSIQRFQGSSHKTIKLTSHSCDQFSKRLGIVSKDEMRKVSSMARKNGLKINALNEENYKNFNITYDEMLWLWDKFRPHTNSTIGYLYKGYIFVFTGGGSETLKTVFYPGGVKQDKGLNSFKNSETQGGV